MRFTTVIVGGGTGGITTAARLCRAGITDIAIVEPSDTHYYQPLWTLVGAGLVDIGRSARPMVGAIPRQATWIRSSVEAVHPGLNELTLADGRQVGYRRLVIAAGLYSDWRRIPGLQEAVDQGGACSVYRPDLALRTWQDIKSTRSGTAVFVVPPGPIKCPGAGQKIAYMASDYWRSQSRDIDVHLVLPGPRPFAAPRHAQLAEEAIERWGITVHVNSAVTAVDLSARKVVFRDAEGFERLFAYDLLHVVPPQAAPAWIGESGLAAPDDPFGFVEVDQYVLRHPCFPDIFALGDAAGTMNVKTGAAVRKQSPVLVDNVVAALAGRPAPSQYDGYGCCPVTTGRDRLFLAEVNYDGIVRRRIPSWPLEIRDPKMWIKRWGLPALYALMLAGRV